MGVRLEKDKKRFSHDKASLDIVWLRDERLEGADNVPDPDVLAQEIIDDLLSRRPRVRIADAEVAWSRGHASSSAQAQLERGGDDRFRPLRRLLKIARVEDLTPDHVQHHCGLRHSAGVEICVGAIVVNTQCCELGQEFDEVETAVLVAISLRANSSGL